MPTPTKPFTVLSSEKKSHRTKKELNIRKNGEEALATGTAIKERPQIKNNDIAHKEFLRINKLLKNIGKNDAIYEAVINRYCVIMAECADMEIKREEIYQQAARMESKLDELGAGAEMDDLKTVVKAIGDIYGTMIALDRQIQTKRRMMLDIEKENIMTIAAALRSIPKKEESKTNELMKILGGG